MKWQTITKFKQKEGMTFLGSEKIDLSIVLG